MSAVVNEVSKRIIANVEKAIVGKRRQTILALIAWFSEGHILLEDVPGVAKTMLARALAKSVGCQFKRVQCTPDLLPTDITGASIFDPKTVEFVFRPGPVFSNILLADEINRATPRTQSAFLEAMAEARVSVDGVSHVLVKPFLVIATQNPIDHEGTFPLPEAQLDRFMMRFSLGYPSFDEELRMLEVVQRGDPTNDLQSVVTAEDLAKCQAAIREIYVDPKVAKYIVEIIHATRKHEDLALGAGPRASIALYRTSQAMAAIRGREFVQPDDIKRVVGPVLSHRLILRPESRLRKVTAEALVDEIVAEIAVPLVANATAVS